MMEFRNAVLINDTSTKAHLGCRVVVAQIAALAAQAGMRITATSSVHADWRTDQAFIETMRSSDIVIVNGEGTLHDSSRQAKALAAVGPYCRSVGIPSVLINTVFERNDVETADACKSFDLIFVRETRSAGHASHMGLNVNVVPDLTLSSDVMENYKSHPAGSTFVVTDNANAEVSRIATEYALERDDVHFMNMNTSEARNPFLEVSLRPDLVLMANGLTAEPAPPRHPRKVAYRAWRKALLKPHMRRRANMIIDLTRYRPSSEILDMVSRAKGVVAGRFHASCMSMLAGTPFAALTSNTSKAEGMLADAGISHILATDPRQAFDVISRWKETDDAAVEDYIKRARNDTSAMFAEIRALS